MGVKSFLQLAVLVLVGAVFLKQLVDWWNASPTYVTSSLLNEDKLKHVPLHGDLQAFIQDFDGPPGQRIIKVTDGIYQTDGYSFGRVVITECEEGLIIIDTSESIAAASSILHDLRKLTNKTIKAIVYTHHHNDHIQGTQSFIEDEENPPDIWAYHTLPQLITGRLILSQKLIRGAVHQFGIALGEARVWPKLLGRLPPVLPTRLLYNEEEQVNIAGANLTFYHVPGEANDEIAVWIPAKKALVIGDNIFKMFPNIYAIRGTEPRDPMQWANSLRQLRKLGAEYMIPGHGPVASGQQTIFDLLTAYSAAIQFVHDQTVRHLNLFEHPDEISRSLQLPSSLASNPFLFQHYGRVDWSSKAVYHQYVGWFSGDPVDLMPLTPAERAQRMLNMIGLERMLDEVFTALNIGDNQWALELASHVVRSQPNNQRARALRLDSLRALAAAETNPIARNFYLTSLLDDQKPIDWAVYSVPMIDLIDVQSLLELMKVQLRAEAASGVNSTLFIHFEDTNRTFQLQVLFSVLNVDGVDDNSWHSNDSLSLTTTEAVWKKIFSRKLTMAAAYSNGDIKLKGSLLDVRKFLSLFETGID